MANYATLKATIAAAIRENGNNEITGNLLQQQLLAMVNSLGVGYQYAGIATPATNPGTPDQNVFYLASTAGTYTNFGGLVLADSEIAILKYNGAWSKDSTGAASLEMVNQLGQYNNVKLKEISPLMEDIYTSESGNYLDVKHVATGIYLDARTNGTPTANAKGVISRFIYVAGVSQVTLSGYVSSAYLGILFLSKPVLDVQYRTNFAQLTNTSRTISVPSGSKYAVVCLVEPDYDANYDYSGVKMSFSNAATTDTYQPLYLGRAGYEYLFNKVIVTEEDLGPLDQKIDSHDDIFTESVALTAGVAATIPKIGIIAKKGERISFIINDDNNIFSEYNFYIFKDGSETHTNIGAHFRPNVKYTYTLTDDIHAVDGYILATDVIGSGTIKLDVFSATTTEIKELDLRTQEIENLFYELRETALKNIGSNIQTDEQIILSTPIGKGSRFAFKLDSGNTGFTHYLLYAKYDGEQNFVLIRYFSVDTINEIVAEKDIVAIQIYMDSPSLYAGVLTLSVYHLPIKNINALYEKENKLGDITIIRSGEIIKTIVAIGQTGIITPAIPVDIKKDEQITFRFNDESGITSGGGFYFYVTYKGASSHTNLGLFQYNADNTLTFTDDIISVEAYAPTLTGKGNLTFILSCEEITLRDELNAINKELENYVEQQNVIKRYLPFTICMKQIPYFVADSRLFQFACNLLFFTDSHTDETFFDGVDLKNVKYVVEFANGLKNNVHDVSEQFVNAKVFDAVINAGDVISSGYKVTPEHDAALALPFFNEIKNLDVPFIIAKGNHDTLITDTAWASMYGDWAQQKFGLVRQTKQNTHKSTWAYYDIESKKIRVIAIDVTDIDLSVLGPDGYPLYNGGNSWYIAQEQMNWLVNTALNFDSKADSDWGVVCVLHQSKQIMWNNEWYAGSRLYNIPSAIEKFFEVCKAFNNQGTYNDTYTFPTDTFYNLAINADFTRYASTKKWKQYSYTQNSGSAGSGKYAYFIKKDSGLTIKMEDSSNHLTQYHVYVWYEGASDYTHIQVCQPNQEYTIPLTDNIVGVQVYANATDITGNVNATFNILENKPHIVCWLNGHEHSDKQMTIDGINIIWTICSAAWTAYSDQRVLRSVGTPTQNAFDCMSIDTINRKIRMIRFGAGVDCFGVGGDRFIPDGLSY